MTKTTSGYIILAHDVMGHISNDEIIATLPEDQQTLDREIIHIAPEKIQHGEAMNYDWRAMLVEQDRLFDTKVVEKLKKHPDYEVLYFGLAPIPLAVHLGHRMSSFRQATAYLKDHTAKVWKWADRDAGTPQVKGVPRETFKGAGDVVIRFGTRFEISADDTSESVSDPIREIEIYPPQPGGDIFGSFEQMARYAAAFRDALDAVSSRLPEVRDVHLFGAFPVGLAFLIGQEISPTAHPLVHVYEYSKDRQPAYYPAYTVNADLNAQQVEITAEDRKKLNEVREELQKELGEFQETFLGSLKKGRDRNWFSALFPDRELDTAEFGQAYWQHLSRLDQLELVTSFLEPDKAKHPEDSSSYYFTHAFLKLLTGSLPSQDDRLQAARLFCFHATINRSSHRIRSEQADMLAQYPRIQEEVNYQADVYALLHEFAYARLPETEAGKHLAEMIHVLLETLWAFDRAAGKTERMDVHRVNRYLTWYYLAALLETGAYPTLNEVLRLLSTKPLIELKLHAVMATGHRVVFDFKSYDSNDLGLCLFHNGEVESYHVAIGMTPISSLIEGLKEQEPDLVKDVLHALITKTAD